MSTSRRHPSLPKSTGLTAIENMSNKKPAKTRDNTRTWICFFLFFWGVPAQGLENGRKFMIRMKRMDGVECKAFIGGWSIGYLVSF